MTGLAPVIPDILSAGDVGYGLDRTAHDNQNVEYPTGGLVKTEPYKRFYKVSVVTRYYNFELLTLNSQLSQKGALK